MANNFRGYFFCRTLYVAVRYVSSKKISTFYMYADFLIYRDIFGIIYIIGVNTCAFSCQTFKAFSVFVIFTFSGNFVQ